VIFTQPWVLLLLVIPEALAVWEVLRRGHSIPLPFDHSGQPRRRFLSRLLLISNLLPVFTFSVIILILAGPQRLGRPERVREVTNIELCLDVSGSMGWRMASGTRYEVAMKAISAFTSQREGDACGLTIFGGENIRWTPLTKDLKAISLATPFMDPSKMPAHMRSTRIGAALRSCLGTLSEVEEGDRLIILISDGVSSDLSGGNAGRVGMELADANITLYAIHIGDGAAPSQIFEVVGPTGGRVFAAHDSTGLDSIFEHIDRMEPAKMKPAGAEPIDNQAPYALAGLALLATHVLALLGIRYTPW
jgi:Ca-activated chloride channel family protein